MEIYTDYKHEKRLCKGNLHLDGIRKYSKEWFTLNGTSEEKLTAKKLADGVKSSTGENKVLEKSIFLGSKEDFQKRIDDFAKVKNPETSELYDTFNVINRYGAENIFEVLDENGDGTVSSKEMSNIAAINTSELTNGVNKNFSERDLELFYENALASVNAAFVEDEENNSINISYADGTKSTLQADEDGKLESKLVEKTVDGKKQTSLYDYTEKSLTKTYYDSKDRMYKETYDAPGTVDDKTKTRTYNDDGSYREVVDTIGMTTTTDYNAGGRWTTKTETVKYDSDGIIGDTEQESIGDCWVLAGVNSLRETEIGAKILNDSIVQNDDGSVTVLLNGLGQEYTFSPEEIALNQYQTPSKEYSSGDTDMNLIEMAIGKYREELIASGDYKANSRNLDKTAGGNATVEDPLKGGQLDEAIYYLTGVKPNFCKDKASIEDALNTMKNDTEIKYATTVNFLEADPSVTSGKIVTKHAYSLVSVDDDNVYLVNPWHADQVITYPKADFLNNVKRLSITDLGQYGAKDVNADIIDDVIM